jgi:hypothetical protein
LKKASTKVAQVRPDLATDINYAVNDLSEPKEPSTMIESYAKPTSNISVKDNSGVVHSFSVEIKSGKNRSIPDTELMSKILQAIEGHSVSEFDNANEFSSGSPQKFEVVSFKYERKEERGK